MPACRRPASHAASPIPPNLLRPAPSLLFHLYQHWKELTQGSSVDHRFTGVRLLYDAKSDKGISVSHWEREEDIAAFEAGDLYKQQLAKIAGLLAERPTTEIYQVRDQV